MVVVRIKGDFIYLYPSTVVYCSYSLNLLFLRRELPAD